MSNSTIQQKPHLMWRLILIFGLVAFALIENNPIVKLEALIGLSPSLTERIFGVKSLFSGMTAGVHYFVNLDLISSVKANVFAPLIIPILSYYLASWSVPKIDSREKEFMFFSIFVGLSVIVNIVN